MPDADYKINNIVLTVSYDDVHLDLEKIASNLEGARYDPGVFAGVIYRSFEPKATFLIFTSGEVNCVGAKTVVEAKQATEELTDKLQNLGYDVGGPELEVQNMVASVDFHRRFDLEKIARNFRNIQYEPEVFPGLVFRMEGTDTTVLLFVQGKGALVGAKDEENIEETIDRIEETIE